MGVGSGRRPLCLPPQLVKRAKILFRQPHLGALRRPADVASQAALQPLTVIIDFRERAFAFKADGAFVGHSVSEIVAGIYRPRPSSLRRCLSVAKGALGYTPGYLPPARRCSIRYFDLLDFNGLDGWIRAISTMLLRGDAAKRCAPRKRIYPVSNCNTV
jgi:hypothetical protein